MKFTSLLLSFIIGWFALLQYNDPDPLLWISIYGTVAIILLFSAFKQVNRYLLLISFSICLLGSLYLMPSVFEWFIKEAEHDIMQKMSVDKMYIEETRESLGLLIASLFLLVPVIKSKKQKSLQPEQSIIHT